ncbi:hypothetical protein OG194_18180 [Streptomyces sp. NBC_01288]|uniref:hypothetical protein n=1 Tax=Streptomyces sp. NBC_01288 TaxID=2903814 RepID=UPI002E1497F3|nr:hypothetical protein OG194_18180 [Streptomyces sp. NBC_01288]
MTRQRERYFELYEDDFGLSALTGRPASATAPDVVRALECAAEMAADCEGEGAVELGTDIRCLLDSGLPDGTLRAAWPAATHERFDPADFGMDLRTWLTRLADLYPARRRKRRQVYWPERPHPALAEEEVREAVITEIRVATSLPATVPEALEDIAREADGDLGFRLLLRILKAWTVPVAKEQYDRLMELDTKLDYPGPLVYDGLDIQWPPIDPTRPDRSGDFGFSALAERFSGYRGEPTAREGLACGAAADDSAETPGTAAAMLFEDASRLLNSPLSADTLSTLWLTVSGRGLDIDQLGIDGRDWLRLVAEVSEERLRDVAPSYTPAVGPVRTALTQPVLAAIGEATPDLATRTVSAHRLGIPGAAAVDALREVVAYADPDLGYRLFLRLLNVLSVPLTMTRYAGYRVLGEQFGYGADHVPDAVEHPDPPHVTHPTHHPVQTPLTMDCDLSGLPDAPERPPAQAGGDSLRRPHPSRVERAARQDAAAAHRRGGREAARPGRCHRPRRGA